MRIGVLAQAGGTTPRAVRHYHRLGVLPEPERTPSGYREYSMKDLVRLMRIRRLAASGVPLAGIASMTADCGRARDDLAGDISDLVAAIEREQQSLEIKKSRLLALLADARAGRPLTALPRPLADRLNQLIEHTDGVTRIELERERDHLEILALGGNLPEELAIAMAASLNDPESVTSYLAILTRWSALRGRDPASVKPEIDALAVEVAALVDASMASAPFAVPADADTTDLPGLHDVVPDSAQRAVVVLAASILTEAGTR